MKLIEQVLIIIMMMMILTRALDDRLYGVFMNIEHVLNINGHQESRLYLAGIVTI